MLIPELCSQMDAMNASDIFLTENSIPSMRINGSIMRLENAQPLSIRDIGEFIKEYLPAGTLERLSKERDLDIGTDLGAGRRFRVNLSFQRNLVELVMRRIPSGELSPEKLNIPDTVLKMAENARGLILITGTTGSGKTTTMACLLNFINSTMKKHIVTIEDPIEYIHQDKHSIISQKEIGNDTRDFASALKHVVRQNPDVIFIGEMRDMETVSTAISAAMTGHLVIATMHTMNPTQTIERIVNYYPEYLREQAAIDLSYVLVGIASQRLVPKKNNSGRIPVFEILKSTPLVQRLMANVDLPGIEEAIKSGSNEGMQTFNRALLDIFKENIVTLESACAYASNKDEFLLMTQGMETGIETLRSYSADPDHGLSIKKLLRDTLFYKASDLLLTAGTAPAIRIDGVLQHFDMPVLTPGDTQKLLFSVLNARQRADFEERKELDFALSVNGLDNNNQKEAVSRFRVNAYYQKGAIAAAMRVIPTTIPPIDKLGIPPVILQMTSRKQGLVLITGPTGSGKSTTLAAMIDMINTMRPCHIITIEDPIEFVHQHKTAVIDQREIPADSLSFPNALKYILRQDPDVILVGEMRDPETISTVLTAAETGHLVFATLHTNDVAQSIDRIIDAFPPEQQNQIRSQLAACLECVVAQRLLPRASADGGRIAVFEILLGTTAIKAMIREKKTHLIQGQMETSLAMGMVTMERALQNALAEGKITRDTFETYAPRTGLPPRR